MKTTIENIFKVKESPLGKENAQKMYQICSAISTKMAIDNNIDKVTAYKEVRQQIVDFLNSSNIETTFKEFEQFCKDNGLTLKYQQPKQAKKETSKKPLFTPMVALKQQIDAKKPVQKVVKKVAGTPKQNNVFDAMNRGQITPKQILHLNKLGLVNLTSEEVEAINVLISIQG